MKKGEITSNEILELALAAAVIILLVFLLYALIAPHFNKNEETAKSYFNSFDEAIALADKGGRGYFSMWQNENSNFYLVYFNKKISFNYSKITFSSVGVNENHICLCYANKQNGICNFCKNLNYPVIYNKSEPFLIKGKEKIEIIKVKNENFYRFIQIQ